MNMASKTPHEAADHARQEVATYVQKRLQNECREHGSVAALARAVGFSGPHISNAKNYGSVGPDLAIALAKHWGLTYDALVALATGGTYQATAAPVARVAEPAASPAPPPSDVRVTDDAVDAIVNSAFDPTRHKAADVPVVVEALHRTAMLLRDNLDPVAYVARLLDAQADARAKGRRIQPEELPFAALGMTERLLRQALEKMAADDAQAEAYMAQHEIPAPAPGEVHPLVKKAQERERKRREGR